MKQSEINLKTNDDLIYNISFPNSVSGKLLTDWLEKKQWLTREQAVEIGKRMIVE